MVEKINLPTNLPVLVQFLRDDARYGNHPQYGESYSFLANAAYPDGKRQEQGTLRATPKLFEALVGAGCGKMAVAEITKKEVAGNKIDWQVVLRRKPDPASGFDVKPWEAGGLLPGGSPPAPESSQTAPGSPPAFGSPTSPTPTWATFLAGATRAYEECLLAAQMTTTRAFGQEVEIELVKDLATTFFIEGNRQRLPYPEQEPQEPDEVPPPPTSGFDAFDLPTVHDTGESDLPF